MMNISSGLLCKRRHEKNIVRNIHSSDGAGRHLCLKCGIFRSALATWPALASLGGNYKINSYPPPAPAGVFTFTFIFLPPAD